MGAALDYIRHLYSNDLDGYVHIMSIGRNGKPFIKNVLPAEVKHQADQQQGRPDTYISPNTFYLPERSNENIRQYRALYMDLDIHKTIYSKSEAYYKVAMLSSEGKIPRPSLVVDSGQGLHLYWIIEHAPKGAAWTWQELEDYLYKHLKECGADIQATDAARVLRLPGTINTKNGETCKVIESNAERYSMYELRKDYLDYGQAKQKPVQSHTEPRKSTKSNIKHLFNNYTLHMARLKDIEKLTELRGYDMEGYRNAALHCYIYWQGVCNRDFDNLLEVARRYNDKLKVPEKDRTVQTIVKSTMRAIVKFIDYEQGIRSGEKKRITKGMRDKAGYWYTNKRLIEMFDITPEEQRQLKTIISQEEKYRRRNEANKKARRNENGLTSREQHTKDTREKIHQLREKGLTIREIAQEMNLTIKGVEYHLYD